MNDIRFGTDGWRGIIANDFTFENVRKVAEALAAHIQNTSPSPSSMGPVVIGYDTRFHSKRFAETVADTIAKYGCRAIISDSFVSTPAVSSGVVDLKAFCGVMISASHNPPLYNGIKFKTSSGSSAPEIFTAAVESLISSDKRPAPLNGSLEKANLSSLYIKRLRSVVEFRSIKKARLKIVNDPMYGSAIGYIDTLLKGTHCSLNSIHTAPDPMFGGIHPEPIEENLSDLKKAVKMSGAACGLATDGDGDRVGVVDETGRYLTPHQVFPLLLYYLTKYKGMKGKVVQTISLGYLSQRIAADFGLEWEEVSVGFKYIADRIINEKILIGGEESGGYGYGNFLPERDGVLNSLMIIEMLAQTGKTLSSLLRDIEKKYGTSVYLRTDFKNPGILKSEFVEKLKNRIPDKIAGLKIKQVKDYDGIEFVMEDDSWLLLRPSGTEPIIRVYSESSSLQKTKKIISWGHKAVQNLDIK